MTAKSDAPEDEDRPSDAEAEPKHDAEAEAEPKHDAEAEAEPKDDPEAEAEPKDDAEAKAASKPSADADPERPPFAKGWPDDPELFALLSAFARGNYAHVRAEAPKLAARTRDPAVHAAANDLRRRIDPDPVSSILLLLAVALLVVLASHYLGHRPDKPAGPTNEKPPPPQPTAT